MAILIFDFSSDKMKLQINEKKGLKALISQENLNNLKNVLNRRKIIFVCIGTPKLTMDAFAPRLGTLLEKEGYMVFGTEANPIERPFIKDTLKQIKRDSKGKFILAIDAAVSNDKNPDLTLGEIIVSEEGLIPGLFMGEMHKPFGNANIKLVSMKDHSYITKGQLDTAVNETFELIKKYFRGGKVHANNK